MCPAWPYLVILHDSSAPNIHPSIQPSTHPVPHTFFPRRTSLFSHTLSSSNTCIQPNTPSPTVANASLPDDAHSARRRFLTLLALFSSGFLSNISACLRLIKTPRSKNFISPSKRLQQSPASTIPSLFSLSTTFSSSQLSSPGSQSCKSSRIHLVIVPSLYFRPLHSGRRIHKKCTFCENGRPNAITHQHNLRVRRFLIGSTITNDVKSAHGCAAGSVHRRTAQGLLARR